MAEVTLNTNGGTVTVVQDSKVVEVITGQQGPAGPSGGVGDVSWGLIDGVLADQVDLQGALDAKSPTNHNHDGAYAPAAHTADVDNPHQVTKAQVGLSEVDNTSDLDKPVSNATAVALVGKINRTGFPVGSNGDYLCTLSYNETTRTVTLTPLAATFEVFVGGSTYTQAGPQSIQHGATQGGHFIYYNEVGTLVATTTPWNLLNHAPVAFIFWDAVNSIGISFEERHHAGRDVYWHRNQHAAEGTKTTSGFGVSGYTLNVGTSDANVSYSIATGRVEDEDIRVDTEPLADGGPYTILERAGASGDWRITRGHTLPFLYSGNSLQYNSFVGGVWQRTSVVEDNYINYYVFAVTAIPTTNITPTPPGTQQIIIVPGQNIFATEALAHGETIANISWGVLPFQEIAPLYQVTMRFNALNPGAFSNTARCSITRLARVIGTATSVTQSAQTDHGILSGLADDDHLQYALTDGTRGNFAATDHTHAISDVAGLQTELGGKQSTLVSGTNIKTINGASILGSGDLVVGGSSPSEEVYNIVNGDTVINLTLDRSKKYRVTMLNVQKSAGSYVKLKAMISGTPQSTAHRSASVRVASNAGSATAAGYATTSTEAILPAATANSFEDTLIEFNIRFAGSLMIVDGVASGFWDSVQQVQSTFTGAYSNSSVNGMRIELSTGTFVSGTVTKTVL